ncbi:hypothetical protein D3C86_2072850 [compost metagenome]
MNIVARARFAKTAENALITVNHDHCHAGGTAAVINQIGVTIRNIGGENGGRDRLSSLNCGEAYRTQRGNGKQTTFQRKHP